MKLQSIASAFPDRVYTQEESYGILERSGALGALRGSSVGLLRKVLLGDSGIATRRYAVEEPEGLFGMGAGELNGLFERYAPALAAGALEKALGAVGVGAGDLDALYVCTCTGYLCPGVTSHVAERLGMRGDAYLQDLVGLGCGAAVPMLRSASHFLAAEPGAVVGCVAVEVCSTAFLVDDDPGQLISLCLFGDGASASVWGGSGEGGWRLGGFDTIHRPEERERIRFVNQDGYLKNQLDQRVPQLAAEAVGELYARGGSGADVVVSHTGGRDVLQALGGVLPGVDLGASVGVLRDYGNVSSPSVLLALERVLGEVDAGVEGVERIWMTGFGAGFSAHSAMLRRDGRGG